MSKYSVSPSGERTLILVFNRKRHRHTANEGMDSNR